MTKTIVYFYRGLTERGADYRWVSGYSEVGEHGGEIQPWMTQAECYRDAARRGAEAVFVDDPKQQRD